MSTYCRGQKSIADFFTTLPTSSTTNPSAAKLISSRPLHTSHSRLLKRSANSSESASAPLRAERKKRLKKSLRVTSNPKTFTNDVVTQNLNQISGCLVQVSRLESESRFKVQSPNEETANVQEHLPVCDQGFFANQSQKSKRKVPAGHAPEHALFRNENTCSKSDASSEHLVPPIFNLPPATSPKGTFSFSKGVSSETCLSRNISCKDGNKRVLALQRSSLPVCSPEVLGSGEAELSSTINTINVTTPVPSPVDSTNNFLAPSKDNVNSMLNASSTMQNENKNVNEFCDIKDARRVKSTLSDMVGVSDSSRDSDISDMSLDDINCSANDKNWRSKAGGNALRRSARLSKTIQRFDPCEASIAHSFIGAKDVFGDVVKSGRSVAGLVISVKSLVKECQRIEKREEENVALRTNMEATTNALGNDERRLQSFALTEKLQLDRETSLLSKYSLPLPVFCGAVAIPDVPLTKNFTGRDIASENWLELLACGSQNSEPNLSLGMIASLMSSGRVKMPISSSVGCEILRLCVFERRLNIGEGLPRDTLLESFLNLVRSRRLTDDGGDENEYPSLFSVLRAYGALLGSEARQSSYFAADKDQKFESNSLDFIAGKSLGSRNETENEIFAVGIRNVGRAFKAAFAQIESGWRWRTILGSPPHGERSGVIETICLCTRVLLSSFGSRLKRECGSVISAALMRIPDGNWPSFRWDIAKSIVTMTPRLQLHVELATFLFPMNCGRALTCSLDVAYLSLVQWSHGPNTEPEAKDISNAVVSNAANDYGVKLISFCLEDVLKLLEKMPELDKRTDVVWACGVACLLKQVLTMPVVVERRKSGHLGLLHQIISKLRHCTHRMRFDVAVQEMRMALDALLRVLRSLGSSDKVTRAELYPNTRGELVQQKISTTM